MTIAQKTGSDPVIEPDPVRSGVCTYPILGICAVEQSKYVTRKDKHIKACQWETKYDSEGDERW